MNLSTSFVLIAFFVFAAAPFGLCFINILNQGVFDVTQWIPIPTKLYIHTKQHPMGVEFDKKNMVAHFKKATETKIIAHGYRGNRKDIQIIVNEYLNNTDFNVLTYDWDDSLSESEVEAAMRAVSIEGFALGREINMMLTNFNIEPEQIHLIGHKLGAHLMGAVGRQQIQSLGRITDSGDDDLYLRQHSKLESIAGLDPSSEHIALQFPGLNKFDAKFVDIIHTSTRKFGFNEGFGTVEFFPNGGSVQPQCTVNDRTACNTKASVEYFAESIRIKDSFLGVQCDSFEDFIRQVCKNNPTAIFGEYVQKTISGSYYFYTNSKAPYGRKKNGMVP